MGIEIIPNKREGVWKYVERSGLTMQQAQEIEKMYNVLKALEQYAGIDTITVLKMYLDNYPKQLGQVLEAMTKGEI